MNWLVRYGELALKSRSVRARYERQLVDNLLERLALAGHEALIERPSGRFIVHCDGDEAEIAGIIARTFGVVSLSRVTEHPADLDALRGVAAAWATDLPTHFSFAVRARRTGNHLYTSQELGAELGAAVIDERPEARVDLGTPGRELHVEVRDRRAFVFDRLEPGIGGLPLHTQGKVLVWVETWRDLLAGWLIAKRGCTLELVRQRDPPEAELAALERWHHRLRLHPAAAPAELTALLVRRRADGLVVGWDAERVVAERVPEVTLHAPLAALPAELTDEFRAVLLEERPPVGPSGKA